MVVGAVGLWFAFTAGVEFDPELSRSWALAREARARVQVGMTLQEAEALLSDAWHHAACEYRNFSYDPDIGQWHIFLFGSRDLDKTGNVILRGVGPIDDQVVSFVGRTEGYLLLTRWDCCLKRSGLQVEAAACSI